MKDFESFELEFRYDEKYGGVVWLSGEIPNSNGLKRVSFIFDYENFDAFCNYKQSIFVDGYHKLESFIDTCTFYDMSLPANSSGTINVPYVRVDIPPAVRKHWLTKAKRMWVTRPDNYKRVKYSKVHRNRWDREYGIGKGFVSCLSTPEAAEIISEFRNEPSFARGLEKIYTITKNTTASNKEVALMRLSKDSEKSLYWCAYTPSNKVTMNGGLIYHKSSNDWSVHT